MCDIKDGFRLCSCDDQLAEKDISWVLKRNNPELPLHYRKGRAVMPRYSNEEKNLQVLILENLNNSNCFDFEYSPQVNDFVRIRGKAGEALQEQWYGYRYTDNQWAIDNTDSLAGWKTQLEDYKGGRISV